MQPKYKFARQMRRAMTPPEFLIWERIRNRSDAPIFRRQYAIDRYILDFYCIRAKLAVEVDGEHHSRGDHAQRDAIRDAWLNDHDILVYRLPAADVFADPDACADGIILLALERLTSRP